MVQPQKVQFDDPCVECGQTVIFHVAPHAITFGHVYSTDGLRAYVKDTTCEWCGDILADFATMGRKGDFLT